MLRIIALVVLAAATPATAAGNAGAILAAVKTCIDFVHTQGYPAFDAFYNNATKSVENNVTIAMNQPALFDFNKCMASQGFPLSYGNK
jgi:hypothetical protein